MRAILEIPAAQQEETLALAAAEAQALAANGPGGANAALAGPEALAQAVLAGEVPSLAAPGQSPVASLIEDLTEKLNRSPQKRLEQMIETDEAQAAEILKRWLQREAA